MNSNRRIETPLLIKEHTKMSNIIQELDAEQMKTKIPAFAPGDTVVVKVRVKEGNRERLQAFEGIVIAKRNRGYSRPIARR